MAKIAQYTIKDIPEILCTKAAFRLNKGICDEERQGFKNELSDYLNSEYANGYMLCGIDFYCGIAIFRNFLFGV